MGIKKEETKEIVVNRWFGGFSISSEAFKELIKMGWTTTQYNNKGDYKSPKADLCRHIGECHGDYSFTEKRTNEELRIDKDLIAVVKKLGIKANGRYAELKIIRIPKDVEFTIEEYDGNEHIAEKHRTWY